VTPVEHGTYDRVKVTTIEQLADVMTPPVVVEFGAPPW
jgi:hypothetical protein